MMRRLALIVVAIALFAVCTAQFAAAAVYSVQLLGVVSGYDGSYGEDINNYGVAICSAASANDTGGVFTWSIGSGATNLSAAGVMPYSINDNGQTIARNGYDPLTGTIEWYVRESNGNASHILTAGTNEWLEVINNVGQIAGLLGSGAPVLREIDGTIVHIPSPGSYSIDISALSNSGEVLLSSYYYQAGLEERSWVWDSRDGLVQLTSLDNTENCRAYGINDSGYIVGRSKMREAIRWNPDGSKTDLGLGCAYGINSHGQMVGIGADGRPVMWNANGTVIDLGLPDGADFALPAAINDLGQVVGTEYVPVDIDGTIWHRPLAVMWNPVPEPSAFAVLACGLVGILSRTRKRRNS